MTRGFDIRVLYHKVAPPRRRFARLALANRLRNSLRRHAARGARVSRVCGSCNTSIRSFRCC